MTAIRKTPEATRRDGVEGRPVVLADGRPWWLAAPAPFLQPRFPGHPEYAGGPDAGAELITIPGYPPPVRRWVAEVRAACEVRDAERAERAIAALGALLLRRAHDLTPTEAASLFRLDSRRFALVTDAILRTVTSEVDDGR